jgi:hypothetical protein
MTRQASNLSDMGHYDPQKKKIFFSQIFLKTA